MADFVGELVVVFIATPDPVSGVEFTHRSSEETTGGSFYVDGDTTVIQFRPTQVGYWDVRVTLASGAVYFPRPRLARRRRS